MSDNEMLKLAEQIEGSSAGVPNDFAAFIQLSGSDMKLIVSALRAAAASAEPVAWIAFAGNGKVRFWTADQARAKREQLSGMDLRMFTLPELVALAGHPAPDAKIVAALELAEDILSRAPFSTAILPNGMHPQLAITQIRAGLAKAKGARS